MSCDRRLLSEYRDGELSPPQKRLVDEHLSSCAGCRGVLQDYERIARAVRGLDRYEVPAGLSGDVYGRIEAERTGTALCRGSVLRFGSLAAAVLVLAVAAALLRGGAPPQDDFQAASASPPAVYVEQPGPTAVALASQSTPVARDERPAPPAPPIAPTPAERAVAQANPTPAEPARAPAVPPPAGTPEATPKSTPGAAPSAVAQSAPEAPVAVVEPKPATPIPTPEAPRSVAVVPPAPVREPVAPQPTPGPMPSPGPASVATTAEITRGTTVTVTADCTIAPRLGFALVYTGVQNVRRQLGCALGEEKSLQVIEEAFESGQMIWRGDVRQIYALLSKGTWKAHKDSFSETETSTPAPTPPEGKYAPVRGIGKVWREDASLRGAIGWAVEPEQAYSGVIQEFEKGAMLWSDRKQIYVLYDDGTWQRHADTYAEPPKEALSPIPGRGGGIDDW